MEIVTLAVALISMGGFLFMLNRLVKFENRMLEIELTKPSSKYEQWVPSNPGGIKPSAAPQPVDLSCLETGFDTEDKTLILASTKARLKSKSTKAGLKRRAVK